MSSLFLCTDSLFKAAVNSAPPCLTEALFASQLDAPGVLRSYPRYTPEQLGLVGQLENDSVGSVVRLGIGTAATAIGSDIAVTFSYFSLSASSSLPVSSSVPLSPSLLPHRSRFHRLVM